MEAIVDPEYAGPRLAEWPAGADELVERYMERHPEVDADSVEWEDVAAEAFGTGIG